MLLDILSIISPVFICAFIGYFWVKKGLPFETPFVSTLVTNVGAPCLIFSTFMDIELEMASFTTMAWAAFLSVIAFTLVGFLVLKLSNISLQTFLPSQVFPNVGNMGLPLCLFAFGEEGLVLALTYFTVNALFSFTVGLSIASGRISFRELFKNPIFYSILITLTLVFNDFESPAWLYNTTSLLAGLTIPLMLIALGVSLAQFKITSLKRSVSLALLRLVMGFIVANLIAEFMGLEGALRGVLILQCSMPVAVFAYLFAIRYNRQPDEVAATVVISTGVSFLTLPLLLWYVLP